MDSVFKYFTDRKMKKLHTIDTTAVSPPNWTLVNVHVTQSKIEKFSFS